MKPRSIRGTRQPIELERGFLSRVPARDWEHALVSGNGTHGALVFGHPTNETVVLNRAGLFLPLGPAEPPVALSTGLPELRALLDAGKYARASERLIEIAREQGTSGDRWTDPLVPACDLRVQLEARGASRDYARGVDFESGVVSVVHADDRSRYLRRLFVSRPHDVVVLGIRSDGGARFDCALRLAEHPVPENDDGGDAQRASGLNPPELEVAAAFLRYRATFKRTWPGSLRGYSVRARVSAPHAQLDVRDGSIVAKGATEIVVLVRIALIHEAVSEQDDFERLTLDFERLLAAHREQHRALFGRVRLELGGGDHDLASEELLARSRPDALDPTLLEKQFDAGRYAILSSSGLLPPTLQGIWNGRWAPPWSSDFTHDGNLPTAVIGNLCGALPECLLPFLEYHFSKLPEYRENARRTYGCRGALLPSRTSTHGFNNHYNVTWPMVFWTAGAGWAAHYFYDYYLYTGDAVFLAERALPFMQAVADFYEDFSYLGPDGRLRFSPSLSPENEPSNTCSQAAVDATMDHAVARELLTNLIAGYERIGSGADEVRRARALLEKLPDYRINSDGAIAEWIHPELADNYDHRHLSHLYELYGGATDRVAGDPALARAFGSALERRMRIRRRDGGGPMAFGLAQIGLVAASLGERLLFEEALALLSSKYWRNSLVSTHDPGALFNVDICGGLPAMLMRMLVDARLGTIDFCKALPGSLERGSIEGVLCRGQIRIARLEWQPSQIEVSLESRVRQRVRLHFPPRASRRSVSPNSADLGHADSFSTILLEAGTPVQITAAYGEN